MSDSRIAFTLKHKKEFIKHFLPEYIKDINFINWSGDNPYLYFEGKVKLWTWLTTLAKSDISYSILLTDFDNWMNNFKLYEFLDGGDL